MEKKRILITVSFLAIFLVAFWFFRNLGKKEGKLESGRSVSTTPVTVQEEVNQEKFNKAKEIAQRAVENSSTYKFDGFDLKYESFEKLDCEDCFEFVFSFKSRHGGYGNRSGKILTQVITPHEGRVNVQGERVVSVVTDRTFDELREMFLK